MIYQINVCLFVCLFIFPSKSSFKNMLSVPECSISLKAKSFFYVPSLTGVGDWQLKTWIQPEVLASILENSCSPAWACNKMTWEAKSRYVQNQLCKALPVLGTTWAPSSGDGKDGNTQFLLMKHNCSTGIYQMVSFSRRRYFCLSAHWERCVTRASCSLEGGFPNLK